MKHVIKVWALSSDHGDGSGSVLVFPTKDDLIKELEYRDYSEERIQETLDNFSPYENGSVEETVINIEVNEKGEPRLLGRLSFNTGQ